jgi:uncharacterized membrane protein (UPF0127 family)
VRLLVLVLALLVAASLGLFLLGLGQAGADAPNGRAAAGSPAATVEPLTVVTAKGRFPLKVEVVATPEGWQRGLMGRTALAADAGMLFDYGRPREVTMWMKNTPLSLDMVFVGADGRVVRVAERTEPYSEALIPSFQPVLAVLEVAAGTAARLGIAPGSRLEHPIFRRPPP